VQAGQHGVVELDLGQVGQHDGDLVIGGVGECIQHGKHGAADSNAHPGSIELDLAGSFNLAFNPGRAG
jgi:hypothetical protein